MGNTVTHYGFHEEMYFFLNVFCEGGDVHVSLEVKDARDSPCSLTVSQVSASPDFAAPIPGSSAATGTLFGGSKNTC